jgi:O-antigen/teichoic acid export membrane protein
VFWNIAFFPAKVVIPLLAGVVVVRLLRAEGFALYVTALALLDFLGLFSDFGIERALPRFLPEVELRRGRPGVARMLGGIALAKGGVLLVIVLALAVAPQYWIDQFKLGENGGLILVIIGALLVLGALSDVTIQVLYTHFRQRATNTLDILVAIVRPSLTAGFVLIGMGVMGALLALLAATVLAVVISLYLAVQLVRSMPEGPDPKAADVRVPSTRPLFKRFTSYAALNYVINWSVYLYDLDFVLIAMTILIVSPGQYIVESAAIALAYKFAKEILRALVVPLTGVQTPLFARLYAEGRIDGLRTAYATLTKVLVLGLLPAAVGLVLTGRNFLQVLYGQKGGDAVLNPETEATIIACTAILAVGLFGEAMISVALNVLMVYEEYRVVLAARLMSLVSIPLLWALVPAYGAVGGAIAVSISALLSRSVALGFGLTKLHLPFPSRFFVRVGTASIAMGVALLPFLAFLPADVVSTIAMVLTGAAVFFVVFKLLGGMDQADKDRFLSLRLPFVKQALRFL